MFMLKAPTNNFHYVLILATPVLQKNIFEPKEPNNRGLVLSPPKVMNDWMMWLADLKWKHILVRVVLQSSHKELVRGNVTFIYLLIVSAQTLLTSQTMFH